MDKNTEGEVAPAYEDPDYVFEVDNDQDDDWIRSALVNGSNGDKQLFGAQHAIQVVRRGGGVKKGWEETEHPRGNHGNAGEFAPKGGAAPAQHGHNEISPIQPGLDAAQHTETKTPKRTVDQTLEWYKGKSREFTRAEWRNARALLNDILAHKEPFNRYARSRIVFQGDNDDEVRMFSLGGKVQVAYLQHGTRIGEVKTYEDTRDTESILNSFIFDLKPRMGDYFQTAENEIQSPDQQPQAQNLAPRKTKNHEALDGHLGSKLIIKEEHQDLSGVQRSIRHLLKIPETVLKHLASSGVEFYIGAGAVPGLDSMQRFAGIQPRGWPPNVTFDSVPGCYNPNERKVIIGSGSHGSASVALHETGHAIDDVYMISQTTRFVDLHKAAYPFLSPYLQQDGPGMVAGCQETFAELYAKNRMGMKYDNTTPAPVLALEHYMEAVAEDPTSALR